MDVVATASGCILIVGERETGRELEAVLSREGYVCRRAENPAGVLSQLRREPDVDLLLLVPDATIRPFAELCRQIKFDARTAFVAVIFALAGAEADKRPEVFAAGADDCIQLPASPAEITLRLSNACRVKRATDSLEDATAVISSLANAIEGRDAYTRGHVERVGTYAVGIGQRIGLSPDELSALRIGGVVHDIGKVAVPDHILNKPGRLTEVEMELVKRHPIVGYDILQPLRTFRTVLPVVRWHHERPNGKGYPDGLAGQQLPLLPRIVAVADVFDALSTARSYRPAFPPAKCRETMINAAAQGDLDASLVAIFLQTLSESAAAPAGSTSASGALALLLSDS
jgi:putative two-component system response regulator